MAAVLADAAPTETYTRVKPDPEALQEVLGVERDLSGGAVDKPALACLRLLATQAVVSGIDYATLGQGWDHPTARTLYREATHASFTNPHSRRRQEASKRHLQGVAQQLEAAGGDTAAQQLVLADAFLTEIGVDPVQVRSMGWDPQFGAIAEALEAELVLPLRSLNEGTSSMYKTFNGEGGRGAFCSSMG